MPISPQDLRLEALHLAHDDCRATTPTPASDVVSRAESYFAFLSGPKRATPAKPKTAAKPKVAKPKK